MRLLNMSSTIDHHLVDVIPATESGSVIPTPNSFVVDFSIFDDTPFCRWLIWSFQRIIDHCKAFTSTFPSLSRSIGVYTSDLGDHLVESGDTTAESESSLDDPKATESESDWATSDNFFILSVLFSVGLCISVSIWNLTLFCTVRKGSTLLNYLSYCFSLLFQFIFLCIELHIVSFLVYRMYAIFGMSELFTLRAASSLSVSTKALITPPQFSLLSFFIWCVLACCTLKTM